MISNFKHSQHTLMSRHKLECYKQPTSLSTLTQSSIHCIPVPSYSPYLSSASFWLFPVSFTVGVMEKSLGRPKSSLINSNPVIRIFTLHSNPQGLLSTTETVCPPGNMQMACLPHAFTSYHHHGDHRWKKSSLIHAGLLHL